MIKRILSILILVPIAIVLIMLSVANRENVVLKLNPFQPGDSLLSLEAPFFIFLFGALMTGMIIGSVATWLGQGKYRSKARAKAYEAVKWETEAGRQKAKANEIASAMALPSPQKS